MTDKMIVVADLGRVKAYRVSCDLMTSKPQMELIYDCEFLEAHGRIVDKVADHAGRFAAGGTPGASNGENHNLQIETERRLIRLVAEKISDLVHGQRYWYFAAAERINGRIVEILSQDARGSLYKNVSADLVKTPKQEIMDYFMTSVV
jgi:hypothetical protein